MIMGPKTQYKSHELPWGIEITQFVYLIFSIFGTLGFLLGVFVSKNLDYNFLWLGVIVIIFWILFYGTYKIKRWVVTPVLVFSAFFVILGLFEIMAFHPTNYIEIAKKAVTILKTTFFLFQLYIFSRPKTKAFFKEKGTTIVS
jgi:hypothetical protein